ncbi:MAG: sigma-70 family RNA polymerase sigma factor, partial [Lachnospiraceae bacterium]|nr:sigma-70 family RNA polymerase sigma factor [Lachnospiraceae bacterium]
DVEECKQDSYLTLWNRIPPERPDPLRTYLCRIVRNTALKKFRDTHAKKRWREDTLCFEELAESVPARSNITEQLETKELTKIVEQFLDNLNQEKRIMFVKRYWFCMTVKDIASEYGMTERHASVILGRIRKKLKQYLQQEDWL